MKICYLSAHFSGAIKLQYLLERGVNIDAIVNITPEMAARNHVAGYHDFAGFAQSHGCALYRPGEFSLRSDADLAFFRERAFDLALVSGWQRLIPADILASLGIGAVAEHGSSEYLPRGRGRSPMCWSLLEGRKRFVVHLFMADADADSGDIIDYEPFELEPHDTVYTAYAKASLVAGKLFLKNQDQLADGSWRPAQTADIEPSYFPKMGGDDNRIDWNSPTTAIVNKVRATTRPYPGAQAILGGVTLHIWRAQSFSLWLDDFSLRPGHVMSVFPDGAFLVKTIDGNLLVTEHDAPTSVRVGDILA